MVYWAAVLDGDLAGADLRKTRAEARRDAKWIKNHPACRDRVRFGNGGHVRVLRLTRCETGELVEVGELAEVLDGN